MASPVVVCSVYVTSTTFAHLKNFAALEIVRKPFKAEDPFAAVERILPGESGSEISG